MTSTKRLSLSDEIAVIFDGKLMQVATPHVLYNRPANMQVAKFVGDANFHAGRMLTG